MPNTREKLIEICFHEFCMVAGDSPCGCDGCPYGQYGSENGECYEAYKKQKLAKAGVTLPPESGIGDMSDGYHTFNELYHHRAVLFSVICNLHPLCSWKAKKHHDGTMYDGMFIVGINTPEGQATYHYDIDPYWDMFKVPEAEFAPDWDGHTADEAIRRIALLGRDGEDNDVPTKWISVKDRLPDNKEHDWVLTQVVEDNGFMHIPKVMEDRQQRNDRFEETYGWLSKHNGAFTVTHWMPLPQPPKGE